LILLSFLLLTPLSHAQNQRGLKVSNTGAWGDYYALIIGINDYKEWSQLQTAVNDAIGLKQVLEQRYNFDPKNIVLRINDKAHRLRLLRDLREMASNLRKQDNLLIYYAGHGQLDDLTGDGYWIPVEGKLKDPGTWISHSMLKNVLSSERVKGKNIVVIADSCYSGNLLRGGPDLLSVSDQGYRQKLASLSSLRSRQVITSGGLEPVADGGRDGHSLFAYYFLKALKENQSDIIDIENLIHSRVWNYVAQIGGQRPSIGRLKSPMDEDGQFVLVSSARPGAGAAQIEKPGTVVSQGKIRSTDQQYEILFWESIKDSNNLLMYQDYLQKFPNGTFAQLAKINIEKLSKAQPKAQVQALPHKAPQKTSTSKIQANVTPQPAPPKPSVSSKPAAATQDGRYKLAVFPWRLKGSSYRYEEIFFKAFSDFVSNQNKTVVPRYSYYELKEELKVKKLKRDYFTEDLNAQLWSGSKPNIDLICKIGKELGVDVVFVSNVYTKAWDQDLGMFDVYFIDIHSRQMYSGRIESRDVETDGDEKFTSIAQRVFKQYVQKAGRPATAGQGDLAADGKYVQASLTPVATASKPQNLDDSRIKLAIFPWKLTGAAPRWNPLALEALTDVLDRQKNKIVPLYTYYAVKTKTAPEVLGKNFFTKNVVKKLWSGSGDGPNVPYVLDLGKQLGIDVVFICNNDARTFDPDPGTYKIYIVDVHSGKMYKGRATANDIESQGGARFTNLAQRLLAEFIQNR
jgi:uncharacterized caspase-like protein